jgi:excisionase family DNA binding protein
MADGDETWLSLQEVANPIGMSYRTVFSMVRRGEIPAEQKAQGHPCRVRRADVDAFIERSRVRPGELVHLYPPRIPSRSKLTS